MDPANRVDIIQMKDLSIIILPAGLEPTTYGSQGHRSNRWAKGANVRSSLHEGEPHYQAKDSDTPR